MCGIAGIIGPVRDSELTLQAMLLKQQHRGPDAMQHQIWPGKAALGHNRLSIIDLHAAANQPMTSANGRYSIVFNGEIYNYLELKQELQSQYRFTTSSDTEVLLAAFEIWGIEPMLPKLNGMFAIAIWDNQTETFWGVRDRFGVKPFYYLRQNEAFFFASEPTTLFAAGLPQLPNERVWAAYFATGSYGQPNETFWRGIEQLPAGHLIKISHDQITIKSWYSFVNEIVTLQAQPDPNWEETYQSLLYDTVKLRFRSDVPVGFNLSGGLDSSTLLALVDSVFPKNTDIEAFTFITGDDRYDELPWVEKMVALTGHHLNVCKLNAPDIPELAAKMCRHQMEPYGGFPTLAYSTIFKQARQMGVIVLLDGQGMDEAWAGYDYYTNQTGNLVQGIAGSPVRPEVLDQDFLTKAESFSYPKPFADPVQNLQYRDIFYTKIPRALRFNDRVSMMYSTELREPFLDYRLVQLAFAQPVEMKIRDGQRKWMLRQMVKNKLGDALALAPKRPLQTPQREWLAGPLAEWAGEQIRQFSELPWANKTAVLQSWENYKSGNNDNSFYIWQWINAAGILKP